MNHPILVGLLAFAALAPPLASPAAVPAAATPRAPTPRERRVLPFIADDYARAVAEARARQVPLFIEAWAPW